MLPSAGDPTEEKSRKLLRINALVAGLLSLVASLFLFSNSFPFPRTVGWLGLFAACFYFLYFLLFPFICRTCFRLAGVILSQIGVLIVTLSIYYTGGVASPFTFLYFALIVSEAIYGLDNPVTIPASVAGYLLVVGGQFFGLLPVHAQWAADVYSSPLLVLIIAALVVIYLLLTKGMSERIMRGLRVKIEQETAENNALLRKFSELNSTTQLGVLAHRIAHDLRGPIASISGFIELEMAKAQKPEDAEDLRQLSQTVANMVESLHGITRFGKAAGPSREDIRLADFMRDLVGIASFSPKARGVKFSVTAQGDGALCASASRADLQQAIFNAVKNAVEAVADNPDSKQVDIVISRDGADACIAVSDNGPGIPEETLRNIFRRSVTTKPDGTGVGLMITRDLLLRNKGEVKLRNRPGGGLTVEVRLPAA